MSPLLASQLAGYAANCDAYTNLTLAKFEKLVKNEMVGYCTAKANSAASYKKDSPRPETWHEGPFTSTHPHQPVPRADGFFGSDDLRDGHFETVPCGAYGCPCEWSPGNCAGAG